jgi:HPt (histidine-containing phosphotransfer) domain-containing protein
MTRWTGSRPRIASTTSRSFAQVLAATADRECVTLVRGNTLVDSARLLDLNEQYGAIVNELIAIFTASTPEVLNRLTAAHRRGDAEAVRQAAHNLKGASQNVGATFMAGVAGSVEADPSVVGDGIDRLRAAFEPTVAQLCSIVAAPPLDA